MLLDLTQIPFSRFGSFLAISQLPSGETRTDGLYLRSVRGPATNGRPMQELLRIEVVENGQPINYVPLATFTHLRLDTPSGHADLCMPSAETLRVRLENVQLRFYMTTGAYDNIISNSGGAWLLTVNTVVETKLKFTPLKGQIEIDAPWQDEHSQYISIVLKPDADGIGEFAIDESIVNWSDKAHTSSFDACLHQVDSEFRSFVSKLPEVPSRYTDSRLLAGYTLWSCFVSPSGYITRPAIYASKNGMIGIWSWDHAFHTLALVKGHPELAWDQFRVIFDHQDESGALPDLINDRLVSWSFCKPPIHGWILSRLMKAGLLSDDHLRDFYPCLAKWTDWWFVHRDSDSDGIPQYNHGNDSGWDNSTVFVARPPIESPDLSTYLVLQMEFLAEVARRLGLDHKATEWLSHTDRLTASTVSHFWRGDRFVATQIESHTEIVSKSLLLFIPLLLGMRLPSYIRRKMISHLKVSGEFLTPFGLATENLKSPFYQAQGYWRGPIWSAPTLILIDALERCGESDFAINLRKRFCRLVHRSGMAENFNALTGKGYHDFHFSWTAAIFLVLAHELLLCELSESRDNSCY